MARTLFIVVIAFGVSSANAFFNLGMMKKRASVGGDPCSGTPAIGTACTGGALYAGQFDSGKYMVTPGGCTDSATPTCLGGTDTVAKTWRGSTGSDADIAGLTNHTDEYAAATQRGHVTTPLITADASTSSDSAADYCENMTFGGYSDWYLPSKTEMSHIFCYANMGGYNTGFGRPQDDMDCASKGGKSSGLNGFRTSNPTYYWTSTEQGAGQAWNMWWSWQAYHPAGYQAPVAKSGSHYVRCIRRY